MRTWYTYGAFGDTMIELSFVDILKLLLRRELVLGRHSVVLSIGKSRHRALGNAESRERQLARRAFEG